MSTVATEDSSDDELERSDDDGDVSDRKSDAGDKKNDSDTGEKLSDDDVRRKKNYDRMEIDGDEESKSDKSTSEDEDEDEDEDHQPEPTGPPSKQDFSAVTKREFNTMLDDCESREERHLLVVYRRVIGLTNEQIKHLLDAWIRTPYDLMEQAKDSLVRLCDAKNSIIPAGRQQRLLALKYWMLSRVLDKKKLDVRCFTDEVRQTEQFALARD
jgi:hypothetical protein